MNREKTLAAIIAFLLLSFCVKTVYAEILIYDINPNSNVNNQTSLDSLASALELEKNDSIKVNLLLDYGWEIRTTSPEQALEFSLRALTLATRIQYLKGMSDSYNKIGELHRFLGDYDQAIRYYFQALTINEEIDDKKGASKNLNNIGIVYKKQGNYEQALEYYKKSLKVNESIINSKDRGYAGTLNNIGNIYLDQSNYKQAIEYFLKSLGIKEELGDSSGIASSLNNIGRVYYYLGNFELALDYYQRSLHIEDKLNNQFGIAESIGNIGAFYYERGNYDKAKEYQQRCLEIAKKIGYKFVLMGGSKMLSNAFAKLNNYDSAYHYNLVYTNYKDSLFNEEKSKEIGRLEAKHEFTQAEIERKKIEEETRKRENELRSRKILLQDSAILIIIVVLFIAILFSGKLRIPERLAKGGVFFTFLLLFEFILILLDPYIDQITGGEPAFKLLFNATLAILFFPLHSFSEKKLNTRLFQFKTLRESTGNDLTKFVVALILSCSTFSFVPLEESLEARTQTKTSIIDSLKKKLEFAKQDTLRLQLLENISQVLSSRELEQALLFSKRALRLAIRIESKVAIRNNHKNCGEIQNKLGNYKEAVLHYRAAIVLDKELNDQESLANSFGLLGLCLTTQADYGQGIASHLSSIEIKEKLRDKMGIANSLNNIGVIYHRQNDFATALDYYNRALGIRKEFGTQRGIGISLNNIGGVYDDMQDHAAALDHYNAALKIMESIGEASSISSVLNNIAIIYYNRGEEDQNQISKNAYIDSSLKYAFRSLKIDEKIGNKFGIAISLNNIGETYDLRGIPDMALEYCNRSLKIANEIRDKHQIMTTCETLSLVYAKQKNFQQAYINSLVFTDYKDSLFNEEKSKEIGKLEGKHELVMEEIQQKRIEEQNYQFEMEQRMRRNIIQDSIILLIIVFLFLAIIFSGKLRIPEKLAEGGVFFTFLILFEFILVLLDPYVEDYTRGEPGYKLMINAILAILIFPLHGIADKVVRKRLFRDRNS